MWKISLFLVVLVLNVSSVFAQTDTVIINADIILPKDSLEGIALLKAVNAFLHSAHSNSTNAWVLAAESVETQILIDEIQGIQKSEDFESSSFFKPYLANINPLEDGNYAVHIAYMGMQNMAPILRSHFQLIAHKTDDSFLISSPLVRNTQHWKSRRIENHIFHYPYTLNVEKMEQFCTFSAFYDEKLGNIDKGLKHHYLCSEEMDPLELFGVEHKSDYNGIGLNSSWESSNDEKTIIVESGSDYDDFDTHDLWHYRLSQVVSRKEVHRRVDCHIATLYGGLWGKSWDYLFPLFIDEYSHGEDVDWLTHKKNSAHFVLDGRKNYSDDFVGALIIKQVEEERGFDGVWELLRTKRTKEEDEYFATLERLIGLNKDNYNLEVSKLIKQEMDNHRVN